MCLMRERERVGLEYNKKKEREGEEEYREGGDGERGWVDRFWYNASVSL